MKPVPVVVSAVPKLAAEFDRATNPGLDPDQITVGSVRRVWWRCAAGHRWQARIDSRARSGAGCPVCAGRVAGPENNLGLTHPEVAALWHPDRNGELRPADVVGGSKRTVWWRCARGHEWQSLVVVRTRFPKCPQCEGWVLTPQTSLAAVTGDIAAQWHPTGNGSLTAQQVSPRSLRRVVWLCPVCGHAWAARVRDRVVRGTGCPECAWRFRRRALDPITVTHPQLVAQWHPTRNALASPAHVTHGSGRRVWWLCELGHEWNARVAQRSRGSGCPTCSGWRFTEHTTLARTDPALAAQWHPQENGELTAHDVTAGSGRKVRWLCPDCAHVWTARVAARSGSGCPECARRNTQRPQR
jgi:predicted  nucleic acid-binding Zn-ribbon protein